MMMTVICRHLACEEDREEEVRLLVSAGADATLANEVFSSAFIISCRHYCYY